MAQAEDEGLSEEDKSLAEEIVLLNKEVFFSHNSLRDKCILGYPKPRSDTWVAVQRNVLGSFASTNKHYKNKVRRRVLKYLREKLRPPY